MYLFSATYAFFDICYHVSLFFLLIYWYLQGSALKKLYESWEENPDIGLVALKVFPVSLLTDFDFEQLVNYFVIFLKGSGRAFCAGGDIVGARELINKGKILLLL